ncbi:hypothetical protein PF002_g27134 [Phytophthora fragariae]|uniref:Uncharacterized protein n=1 Tax=Phytophthora fragariae TaxID=53985 RepID=A0A6A3WAL2_9STRA|nr:hypothetical protein PF002_g27134 [Phytophthora fragariae]
MPPPPIGYPPGHANHAEADRYTNAAALRVLDGTPIRRITVGPGSVPQEHNARSGGDVQPVRDDATQQPAEPDGRQSGLELVLERPSGVCRESARALSHCAESTAQASRGQPADRARAGEASALADVSHSRW